MNVMDHLTPTVFADMMEFWKGVNVLKENFGMDYAWTVIQVALSVMDGNISSV